MGPSRKRVRTQNPKVEESRPAITESSMTSVGSSTKERPVGSVSTSCEDASTPLKSINLDSYSTNQVKSRSSWYGTWPRKTSASTQIVRDMILADKPVNGPSTADLSRYEQRRPSIVNDGRPPSMFLGKSKETSDISMAGTSEVAAENIELLVAEASKNHLTIDPRSKTDNMSIHESSSIQDAQTSKRPATSSGWLGGWLSKPVIIGASSSSKTPEESLVPPVESTDEASEPPAPTTSEEGQKAVSAPTPSASWFGIWSMATPSTVAEEPEQQLPVKVASDKLDTAMKDGVVDTKPVQNKPAPTVGSSWAFWSAENTKKVVSVSEPADSGEIAVEGEASESRPEPAKIVSVRDDKKDKRDKKGKRDRSVTVEENELAKKALQVEPPSIQDIPSRSPAPVKTSPPNLLMPSVRSTYQLVENPSILQQITRILLRGQQKPAKHVSLTKESPKIKKALAIGIHGLFPAPLLRTVIGQPTGTSIRFANHAAAAIRRWGNKHGYIDCEIEKVALEGEGKIAERVDNLWKLLLNWIEHVRKADFIMIACHSQGVPVAIMLVAKLIEFGVVSTGKIGVCAMAGVSLGPFADYKSRLFSGSAGELFEFADPKSVVSVRYEESLRVALKYGARITYCGSIDDQLVSMESSIFSSANHPYIYRAVFVDGRIHAPNFLSHLIGFALKLRNLGVSDHGLIRELSAPLAGSLYTGEGHSRLYDDENVYDLAIEFTLETTSIGNAPLEMQKYEVPTNANPYVLPWIMRGLLEEDFVKTELDTEVTELLQQFDDWKPSTKVLKDVKYRLEAVRSKL